MKNKVLYNLIINLINLISKTWRINIDGIVPEKPCIVAFWHGYMLPGWKIFSGKNPSAVVSQSKDGQILSDLLVKWGFSLIRGSSSKDSKIVLDEMVREASNKYLLITPDGPRGPYQKFKPGAVVVSHRAGVPLILANIHIHWKFTFIKSWDRFELPMPFSKVKIRISEPIKIPKEASREYISKIIDECEKKLSSNQ